MTLNEIIHLSYEEACNIAGVPYERGYVTLNEVLEKLKKPYIFEGNYVGFAPLANYYDEDLGGSVHIMSTPEV